MFIHVLHAGQEGGFCPHALPAGFPRPLEREGRARGQGWLDAPRSVHLYLSTGMAPLKNPGPSLWQQPSQPMLASLWREKHTHTHARREGRRRQEKAAPHHACHSALARLCNLPACQPSQHSASMTACREGKSPPPLLCLLPHSPLPLYIRAPVPAMPCFTSSLALLALCCLACTASSFSLS